MAVGNKRILKEGTTKDILWLFIKEDLELRTEIEHCLDNGSKINAIKCLKGHTENLIAKTVWPHKKLPTLREYKDAIDKYDIRYRITKKIKLLRDRIEKWCKINGYDNMGYQKEVKDNKTGEYTYRYTDWEYIDDQYGLMINDWDWLPHRKTYTIYNTLWKTYI